MIDALTWKLNRLRCMSPQEILYRASSLGRAGLEARGVGLAKVPVDKKTLDSLPWITAPGSSVESGPYLQRADRVLAGEFDVFSLHAADLGFPPQWNKDPKTGRTAPLLFGKTLNYRDESIAGDIKYLWEINRHRELVWLAQAWALSGDQRYLSGISTMMSSWFAQCPYPLGVNWTSSLEHAVRLINWACAWSLIGGSDADLFSTQAGQMLRADWTRCIYEHMHFISNHFSRFSSANNHLIGEYAGLYVASTVWPFWRDCDGWRETARAGLEQEIHTQTFDDGFNKEQATWYHHEVADLFLICGVVARAAGTDFTPAYWSAVEAMINVVELLMDSSGNVPAIGDSDDAVYLELGIERNVYSALLCAGALLFDRSDFKAKAKILDARTHWLLGADSERRFQDMPVTSSAPELPAALPSAGYHLLGSDLNERHEIRVLADSGPLGFLSIAAHGHADALAILLSVGGEPFLIDPGTYAYHTEAQWRRYFRSTSAHNTIEVDGQDQSVQAGNFMWTHHAESRCLQSASDNGMQIWKGEHRGYVRLDDPLVHRRKLVFDAASDTLSIWDELDCAGEHGVVVSWHVAPHLKVLIEPSGVAIQSSGARIELSMPESEWLPEILCGEESPPAGWVSESFDEKTPTNTVRFRGGISGRTVLRTRIKINREHRTDNED